MNLRAESATSRQSADSHSPMTTASTFLPQHCSVWLPAPALALCCLPGREYMGTRQLARDAASSSGQLHTVRNPFRGPCCGTLKEQFPLQR